MRMLICMFVYLSVSVFYCNFFFTTYMGYLKLLLFVFIFLSIIKMYAFSVIFLIYFFFCWFPTTISAKNMDGALFGSPEDLGNLQLPTILQVGSFFWYMKSKLKSQGKMNISNYYVAKQVMIYHKETKKMPILRTRSHRPR